MKHRKRIGKVIMSFVLMLTMVMSLFGGISYATITAYAEDTISIGNTWYVGNEFDLKGKWFTFDNFSSSLHSSTETVINIPEFKKSTDNNYWVLETEQRLFTEMDNGEGSPQQMGSGITMGFNPHSGRTMDDQPLGIQILSGTGTQGDPFKFELVYPAKTYTISKSEMNNGDVKVYVNQNIATKAEAEDYVLLEVTPEEGYKLQSLSVKKVFTTVADIANLKGQGGFIYDTNNFLMTIQNNGFQAYNFETEATSSSVLPFTTTVNPSTTEQGVYTATDEGGVVWTFRIGENDKLTSITIGDNEYTGNSQYSTSLFLNPGSGGVYMFEMPTTPVIVSATFEVAYTVAFDVNEHGTAPASQQIASGGKVTQPAAPTAEGWTFDGWYKEAECTSAWDFANDTVTEATTLYAKWIRNISHIVTFKVVNGTWNDGEGEAATADKTVTLSGYEGDTLKLTADQIPAVGSKPNDTYKTGSWDVTPSTDTAITEATTYTYTYAQKETAVVTKAPTAKTLTYNGQSQELVYAGEATGGTMYYALGENATTVPADDLYTTSIPTATDAGTYYVWYKVVGDANHNDTEPDCITCNIQKKTLTVTANDKSKTYGKDDPELDYTVEGLVGDDELTGTLTRAEGQEVGTYAITQGTLSAGDNYSIEFTGADFIITRIPLEITVSTYNGIYDGKAHSITVDVGESDAVVYYGTEELTADNYETAGSTENPTYTDAGEYTVYFYIVSSRYEADPISGSKVVAIRKAEPETSIETEVNTSDDAPAIKVDNLDQELAAKLLTEEETTEYENGTPVLVYLDVTVLDKTNVPAADLTAVEAVMNANGYTYGECLDLSLWKKLGDGTPVQIHDTNGNAIKVTVTIPDTMKSVPTGYTRTYQIIRVHEGVASVMAEGTGATLEISSDKFSSYCLVYKDTKNESVTTTETTTAASTEDAAKTSPKTGDENAVSAVILLMLIVMMAECILLGKKYKLLQEYMSS